jgi:hypothetical protein
MTNMPAAQHTPGALLCLCPDCWVAKVADEALGESEARWSHGFVFVPDSLAIEMEANDMPMPNTIDLARNDGRRVRVYRDPRSRRERRVKGRKR